MSVAFGTIGATDEGATQTDAAYPASIAANNLLLHFVASKFNTSSHSVPSGFALLDNDTAGLGNEFGTDTGTVVASVHQKIATGSESGTEACTITSGSVAQALIARITRSGGSGFTVAATTARWTTGSTSPLSVTFDDAVGFEAGDYVLVFFGSNTNGTTSYGSPALTASGATFSAGTQRAFTTSALGGQMNVVLYEHTVSSGSSSSAPAFQLNQGGTAGEGPVVLVRVRETASGGFVPAWARNANQMLRGAP
jgi:hypothetical protein